MEKRVSTEALCYGLFLIAMHHPGVVHMCYMEGDTEAHMMGCEIVSLARHGCLLDIIDGKSIISLNLLALHFSCLFEYLLDLFMPCLPAVSVQIFVSSYRGTNFRVTLVFCQASSCTSPAQSRVTWM